jgi:hypothetical protein
MIVNYTDNGWNIITQRSHGLLAGQICAQWKKSDQPARWLETLIATTEHDDVYNEFEDPGLLTTSGGPKNFVMTRFEEQYASRLMTMALTKGRFIGLLTARHMNFLYSGDPEGRRFCAELNKQEATWLKEANATVKELDASYRLLEFCDAFSLLICQGMVQPEQRRMEISNGPDGSFYELFSDESGALIVESWPFEVSEFKVSYESRLLEQLVFKNEAAFRKALRESSVVVNELTLRSGNK